MSGLTKKRIIAWDTKFLEQTHKTEKTILIVSGCSFTDSTSCTTMPVTWPAYLRERCGFDLVIDVSSSGCGNEYIATSIVNQIEFMSQSDIDQSMVLVMWTGIDRQEIPTYSQDSKHWEGYIDGIRYIRGNQYSTNSVDDNVAKGEALRTWKNIIMLQNYLENKKIPFGFTFYINEFDPPFLPRRDLTKEFSGLLDQEKIKQLRNCTWIHNHKESPFDWAFYQDADLFVSDGFHLSPKGYLKWTDTILIPNLVNLGLIGIG